MRKFLIACGRVLRSPWVLLGFSIGILGFALYGIQDLGSRFQIDSWLAGIIFGLGFECFVDAIQ